MSLTTRSSPGGASIGNDFPEVSPATNEVRNSAAVSELTVDGVPYASSSGSWSGDSEVHGQSFASAHSSNNGGANPSRFCTIKIVALGLDVRATMLRQEGEKFGRVLRAYIPRRKTVVPPSPGGSTTGAEGAIGYLTFQTTDSANRAMQGFRTAGFGCEMSVIRRRRRPEARPLPPLSLPPGVPLGPSRPPPSDYAELRRRAAERARQNSFLATNTTSLPN